MPVFRNTSTPGSVSFATRQDFAAPSNTNFGGLADIDGDGKLDLITSNTGSSNISLFPNNSSVGTITLGTRMDMTTGGTPAYFSMGDFDGDGKPDIASASISAGRVIVLRNTSSPGTFTFAPNVNFAVGGTQPAGLVAVDMDGDGMPDLVSVNQGSNNFSTFLNNPLHPIAGPGQVCYGSTITLSDATAGGAWSSSNIAIAKIGSTGIVTATGIAGGTATITYAGTAGASFIGNVTTITVTVNPLPAHISGTTIFCANATTALSDTLAGGTWSSSNTTIATAGSSSGMLTGVTKGTATITYTSSVGCHVVTTVTVEPVPSAVTGTLLVCQGSATALSDVSAGGTWSSSSSTTATINPSTAVVTGIAAGTNTISYTFTATGCATTAEVTVNPLPDAGTISGPANVCIDSVVMLSDAAPGGIWWSSLGFASVSATGLATGLSAGTDTIVYTVTNTCGTDTTEWPLTVAQCSIDRVPTLSAAKGTFTIYPNPGNGQFTVDGSPAPGADANISLTITDLVGRMVYNDILTATNGNIHAQLLLDRRLNDGIYIINIRSGKTSNIFKVVVSK